MIIILMFLLLVMLGDVRRLRKSTVLLEERYQLFALRDELRNKAIEDRSARGWLFRYLDSTITKTISILPEVSLWRLLVLYAIHKDDASIQGIAERVEAESRMPQNKDFLTLRDKYIKSIGSYIHQRHKLFIFAVTQFSVFSHGIKAWSDKWKQRSRNLILTSPEMSTIQEFAQTTNC